MRFLSAMAMASITKTFTVTLLLMLAGEKKVGLDDPVSKSVSYVPNGDNVSPPREEKQRSP